MDAPLRDASRGNAGRERTAHGALPTNQPTKAFILIRFGGVQGMRVFDASHRDAQSRRWEGDPRPDVRFGQTHHSKGPQNKFPLSDRAKKREGGQLQFPAYLAFRLG